MSETVDALESYLALTLHERLEVAIQKIPFYEGWNMKILEASEGYVQILVPFQARFIGNFLSGFWHGGMLSAVCDMAGGFAVAAALYPDHGLGMVSTIDLRIDYLKAVKGKDIAVSANVIRKAKRSMFVDMSISYIDDSELLTIGRGVFNLRNNAK